MASTSVTVMAPAKSVLKLLSSPSQPGVSQVEMHSVATCNPAAQIAPDECMHLGKIDLTRHVCKSVGPGGGIIHLPDYNVSLTVPEGALAKDVDITISTMSSADARPPIDDDFQNIGPIISLEPDNLQLLKAATLTVGHSAVQLDRRCLQIWTKPSLALSGSEWQVVFDRDKRLQTDAVASVHIDKVRVKVRLRHFCVWCWIGRVCKRKQILPCMEKDLLQSSVSMLLFAIDKHNVEAFKEELEKKNYIKNNFLMWDNFALVISYTINMKEDLVLKVKNVKECLRGDTAWKVEEKQKIISRDSMNQSETPRCEFKFTKIHTFVLVEDINGWVKHKVNSISGTLKVKQEGSDANEFTFKHNSMGATASPPATNLNSLDKVTDNDITDIVRILSHDDLLNLYQEKLDLTPEDIEEAQSRALGKSNREKSKAVLRFWRQRNGQGATKLALLEGLTHCCLIDAKETLEGLWGTRRATQY